MSQNAPESANKIQPHSLNTCEESVSRSLTVATEDDKGKRVADDPFQDAANDLEKTTKEVEDSATVIMSIRFTMQREGPTW